MGRHVSAEKSEFSDRMVQAERFVYVPQVLKTPATSNGYMGVLQDVGPVFPKRGELNPSPVASDRAILPSSHPKSQWSRIGLSTSLRRKGMSASRIKNATKIMNRIARRTRHASQKKTRGFRRILIICKTAPVRHLSNKNGASSTPFFQHTMRGDFD